MANKHKQLDATWRRWLEENLERQCDPRELSEILRKNGFSAASIEQAIRSAAIKSIEPIEVGSAALVVESPPKGVDASWQAWLHENMRRGCDPQQLLDTLLQNGFSEQAIVQMITDISAGVRSGAPLRPVGTSDYAAIAAPPLLRRQNLPQLQRVETDALQLYMFNSFLSHDECDVIAAITNRNLRPSTVTIDGNDKYYRTSRTCDLSLIDDPAIAALDRKIAMTLGIRPEYSEGIQAQRYDVGEQFKQHTDYFEPGTNEYAQFAAERGNRTWTFMVYLNEDMQGGGTRFFAIDRTFQPKKGLAVLWNSLLADGTPNHATLHSGEPVLAGHKLIITKWFREKGSGEMFFEA